MFSMSETLQKTLAKTTYAHGLSELAQQVFITLAPAMTLQDLVTHALKHSSTTDIITQIHTEFRRLRVTEHI